MKIHIVQKGDTLWTIAKKYGVNFEELKKMNAQLSNPDLIMPGMKIKVPTSAGMPNKEMPKSGTVQKEKKVEQPIAPVAEVKPPPPPVKEKEKVVVQKPNIMPPPMPPIIPEVEINQIFQIQKTQHAPPVAPPIKQPIKQEAPAVQPAKQPVPKAPAAVQPAKPPAPQVPKKPENIFPGLSEKEEVESTEAPMTPPIMPEMVVPQLQGGCFQPMNPYMPMYHMPTQSCGCDGTTMPQWNVPMMPVQPMTMPMMMPTQPNVNMAMMEESSDESAMMPNMMPNMMMPNVMPNAMPNMMMPNAMGDQVQGVQTTEAPAMQPQAYPMQGYPTQAFPAQTFPAQTFPTGMPGAGCVPVTPFMPGTGFGAPHSMHPAGMGYDMGGYGQQPAGAYPQQMMTSPYMSGQYPTQPMYSPMGWGYGQPQPYGMPRFDEEDEQ
ncbi:SafA/ExsA family spore coat assembly protein [Bacillus sp. Hm123]|uniref:SafA/ExsA family spore coat assembly protein n=1 Tax=Bacillus sp. Hm123 TaxID=3450745 RepID=UPI003F42E032